MLLSAVWVASVAVWPAPAPVTLLLTLRVSASKAMLRPSTLRVPFRLKALADKVRAPVPPMVTLLLYCCAPVVVMSPARVMSAVPALRIRAVFRLKALAVMAPLPAPTVMLRKPLAPPNALSVACERLVSPAPPARPMVRSAVLVRRVTPTPASAVLLPAATRVSASRVRLWLPAAMPLLMSMLVPLRVRASPAVPPRVMPSL